MQARVPACEAGDPGGAASDRRGEIGLRASRSPWRAILPVLAVFATTAVGSSPLRAAETSIRIGVLAFRGAAYSADEWADTARAIEAGMPGVNVQVIPLDHAGMNRMVAAGEVDFVITNPGHYVELEVVHGISRIVTVDAKVPVASAIVVRQDRNDIRTLTDLRGKRIAIVGTDAFGGFQVAWRELAQAGLDPFSDFGGLESLGFPMTQVLDAVVSNKVDAGIVRGCLVEDREREGALARGALRVLSPRPSPLTPCVVSSRLYPDWPLARLRGTPPEIAKKVATALLTYVPADGTPAWTVPVDYQPVHELFKELRIGPYEYLRHVTLMELAARYWHWLAAVMAGFLAWIWHVLRVERLVRRRTVELAAVNADLREEIGKRRRVEEQEALHRKELDHAARLSTLGEMAGGLAHELNQPLAAIANYADGCELRLRGGDVDRAGLVEATRLIRQQADRAAQVIQRMRAFVRKREPVHARLDVDDLVQETIEFFEGLARRSGVVIGVALAPGLPAVNGDRVQLQQVVLNLLQNALDAMADNEPRRRRIEIATGRCEMGVCITVADHGTGMPADVKARLFEPFFTTKPNGLGIGLALCRSIIDEHGGRLTVDDTPGGGTLMRLSLPADAAEQAP
jgi:two-component system sensor histidine kinase TtrS